MIPQIFIGKPFLFKKDIYIYPPTVEDVLTRKNFSHYLQLLTLQQEDIWDLINKENPANNIGQTPEKAPTPFEMLLINAHHKPALKKMIMEGLEFFTKEPVRILPEEKMILFAGNIEAVDDPQDLKVIQEEDYFELQNAIRMAVGLDIIEAPNPDEDPRVARIKAKARERDRIKKKLGAKNGISLTTSMVSLCCMGIGINPLNIGEISYASLGLLIHTYQEKEKYGIDTQFLAGGADPKKLKPKYWIRNLDK